MTGFIPKEKLTAYQRWEVAAFDEAEQAATRAATAGQPNAVPNHDASEGSDQTPLVLPTASDIERMHVEAHEQGYAAGYEEGMAKANAMPAPTMPNRSISTASSAKFRRPELIVTSESKPVRLEKKM